LCTTTPKQKYNNNELKRSYPQITTFFKTSYQQQKAGTYTGLFVCKLPGDQATKKKRKKQREKEILI
jgi:hypothetical protein